MKKLVLILTIALVGVAAWFAQSSASYEDLLKKELAGVSAFLVRVSVEPDSLASLLTCQFNSNGC